MFKHIITFITVKIKYIANKSKVEQEREKVLNTELFNKIHSIYGSIWDGIRYQKRNKNI